jgi:hypothetical protein
MCNSQFNPNLSPVTAQHQKELCSLFPKQSDFISDVYKTLSKNLLPQVNLLVLFTLLYKQYQKREFGIFEKYQLLYVPFSIVAQKNETTWTRFRPKPVKELHTSFLSFMMAETNRIELSQVCQKYGMSFGQSHCCGLLFGSHQDIESYQKTKLYAERNYLRSAIESLAMPVIEDISFDEIPENNIDLGRYEYMFFQEYTQTLENLTLPQSREDVSKIVMENIEEAWNSVALLSPTLPRLQ